jgi:Uma2 family endonuclease
MPTKVELVDGVLVVMPLPSVVHQRLVQRISMLLERTCPTGEWEIQDRIVKHGDYAAAGVPFYLRVDLEKGHEVVEATLFELADGEYRETARSENGMLRSSVPWPFEADLRALATGLA